MRRMSARYAKPKMVLGRPVYDSKGNVILNSGATLDRDCQTILAVHGVGEIWIEDWRVSDVAVLPLIPPEL